MGKLQDVTNASASYWNSKKKQDHKEIMKAAASVQQMREQITKVCEERDNAKKRAETAEDDKARITVMLRAAEDESARLREELRQAHGMLGGGASKGGGTDVGQGLKSTSSSTSQSNLAEVRDLQEKLVASEKTVRRLHRMLDVADIEREGRTPRVETPGSTSRTPGRDSSIGTAFSIAGNFGSPESAMALASIVSDRDRWKEEKTEAASRAKLLAARERELERELELADERESRLRRDMEDREERMRRDFQEREQALLREIERERRGRRELEEKDARQRRELRRLRQVE